MKLVIDRSRWLRGGPIPGVLYRKDDGKLCCLGFFGRACGLSDGLMMEQGSPNEIPDPKWPDWLLYKTDDGGEFIDTKACNALIEINDGHELSEDDRERRIAAEFAKHGVEVEFVDTGLSPGEGLK